MMAAVQMLEHIGESAAARRMQGAIEATLREQKTVTRDVGGTATTAEYTDAVIARL
jgi:isocitrate dehydrogenase (NAD+)